MKAIIFDIVRNSYVDGPGIRTTVFFKGCNLRCKWCHNPESLNGKKEILFYEKRCTHCGRCNDLTVDDKDFMCFNDAKEICGREYSVDEVLTEILKDKSYYENSGGGVTFSGGECMLQIDFLTQILKRCKENGIHTAVDTAGNVSWDSFEKIIPYTDLFLYDIKCLSNERHIKYTSVSNGLILENLKKLSSEFKNEIIIRIPVIEGVNDDEDEMKSIYEFLTEIKPTKVDLLPYHTMGKHKYDALGLEFNAYNVPSSENIEKYNQIFKSL